LWAALNDAPTQGSVQQRWINSLSFWLEILGIILLSVLLSEPVGCSNKGTHRVLVIDVSASMQSTANYIQQIESSIRAFDSTDRISIIAAGKQPFSVVQHTEPYLALEAVGTLRFEHPSSDIDTALQVAEQLTTGEIELWTDSDMPDLSEQITLHALGTPLSNVGLTYAQWRQGVIHLQVSNFSPETQNVHLEFQTPNRTDEKIFEQDLVLTANQQETLKWSPPTGIQWLEINVDVDSDPFLLDNTIWLQPQERMPLTIATDLPNHLSTALGLNTIGQGIFALDTQMRVATPMTSDILFTNRKVGGGPNTWRVEILDLSTNTTQWHGGPFDMDGKHPLLHNVKLNNILWSFDPTVRLQGTPLISIQGIPVLTEKIGSQGRRSYRFNIGSNSTLFKHPDWPIFVNALLTAKRSEHSGISNTNLQPGDAIIGSGLSSGTWQMQAPNHAMDIEVIDGLLDQRVEEIGIHTILQNDEEVYVVGVNLLSAEESNLQNRQSTKKQTAISPEEIHSMDDRNQIWLWLAFILCWLWDWRITR